MSSIFRKIKKYGTKVKKRVYPGWSDHPGYGPALYSGDAVVVEVEAVFRGDEVRESNLL